MGEQLDRICAQQNLVEAWCTTLRRRPEEPAPQDEWDSFEENILSNLEDVHQRLSTLQWHPGRLRKVTIPKASGGQRALEIPSLADRVAERAILAVLTPLVDPHLQPDSYAFRPGLGVADVVGAVTARLSEGADRVVRTDSCLASIMSCARPASNRSPD